LIRNTTWTLSNLCRGRPPPPWEKIKKCLPLFNILLFSLDKDVLMDSCWALCYISEGLIQIQPLIELGICHRIAELLLHTEFKIQLAALRTVGNIVTGN